MCALAALLLARPAAGAEVLSREIGPRSALDTNNTNSFDWAQPSQEPHSGCDPAAFEAAYGRAPCPGDMEWVCSRYFKISVCVDRQLRTDHRRRPLGNFSRVTCASACEAAGKRLPSNNEWLVACTGTPIEPCLNYGGEWPPGHFSKIPGHVCAEYGALSEACMTDPSLTWQIPALSGECVSEAGIYGCVGTLGQWVSDTRVVNGKVRGKFNGGLFPQPASSVVYATNAHLPGYGDYSTGCRCAAAPLDPPPAGSLLRGDPRIQ